MGTIRVKHLDNVGKDSFSWPIQDHLLATQLLKAGQFSEKYWVVMISKSITNAPVLALKSLLGCFDTGVIC